MIAVADPLAALGALAAHWRRRFTLPVIVVVGSNGKTTVKEMIASILRAHFGHSGESAVLATRGNLNNAIGLPLTLLGLREQHRAAVIELGMNHPGETAELAAIARPTVGLVNNAQREHQEFMRSVADVAEEHAALVRALPAAGAAVLNADDAHLQVWLDAARAHGPRVVSFALDHDAVVTRRYDAAGTTGTLALSTPEGEANLRLAAFGRHNASNALAAAAAALAIGVPLAAIVAGLEAFRPVAGRLVERAGASGAVVIDDTYNANPDSVRAAIDVLAQAPGEKWLVLGDMGEVGTQGPQFHREIGEHARARGIDRLYTAGAMAGECAAAFGADARHFDAVEALAAHLGGELSGTQRRGLTILVKGSRFMRMERVVRALAGDAGDGGTH
jgi:UDP-N-acetylmuramoyl-tripeptide--D-alanyl-D-alanine ligase